MTKVARQRAANKARTIPACDACGRTGEHVCTERAIVVAHVR